MSKVDTISEYYRNGGLKKIGKLIWNYTLSKSPIAPIVRNIFGRIIQEKLNKYPQVGYWPQIKNPRTFNEKLMYEKLFTDNEIYSKISDKWLVREYVEKKVGEDILNDVYCVTNDPEAISFESLPNEFVIKATHGSGWNIIADDKEQANFELIRSQCSEWLSETYGTSGGEYWYSQIEPRIIIENYLHDEEHGIPPDFKFFVFHGRVEYIQVDFDRFSGHTRRFYDRQWNSKDFTYGYPLGPVIDEPPKLDEMIDIAEVLGEDFDFIRVDLYLVNESEIVFGELTIAPESASGKFSPVEYDFEFGSYW